MLLDTSGILCYFDIGERHNAEAVGLFRASTSLLMCWRLLDIDKV